MKRPCGFVVIESAEDYEQILALDTNKDKPPGGVLTWADREHPRVMFQTRKAARDAIRRTEHYRLAFGLTKPPEAKFCRVEPVVWIDEERT